MEEERRGIRENRKGRKRDKKKNKPAKSCSGSSTSNFLFFKWWLTHPMNARRCVRSQTSLSCSVSSAVFFCLLSHSGGLSDLETPVKDFAVRGMRSI